MCIASAFQRATKRAGGVAVNPMLMVPDPKQVIDDPAPFADVTAGFF